MTGELEQKAVSPLSLTQLPECSPPFPGLLESAAAKCVMLEIVECNGHTTALAFLAVGSPFSSSATPCLPFLSAPPLVELPTASHFYFMVVS